MAKKPAHGLPDVFAKPGGAPARGTPLEDLPTAEANPDAHTPMAADSAAAPPAGTAGAAPLPSEPPRIGPGASQARPIPAGLPAAADKPGRRTGIGRTGIGGVPGLVWGILIVSLSAPLWEGVVLPSLGIRTQAERLTAQNTADLARQDARVAALEHQLASTNTQLDTMRADLALATLRATQAAGEARAVALLRLADALRGSDPFANELSVLRTVGGDSGKLQPLLAQLGPYATTGVPTSGELFQQLRTLRDSVASAVRQANPGSWMDVISWTGLSASQPSVHVDPGLRAAQLGLTHLAAGDINGAIEQIGQINDAFQADFGDWIAAAKGRLAANAALREIGNGISRPAGAQ
jgi:hypothetical protein